MDLAIAFIGGAIMGGVSVIVGIMMWGRRHVREYERTRDDPNV